MYLDEAAQEEARVPGDVARRCLRCLAAREAGRERKAGEQEVQGEDPRWRILGNWSNPAWKRYEKHGEATAVARPCWKGRAVSAKEV